MNIDEHLVRAETTRLTAAHNDLTHAVAVAEHRRLRRVRVVGRVRAMARATGTQTARVPRPVGVFLPEA